MGIIFEFNSKKLNNNTVIKKKEKPSIIMDKFLTSFIEGTTEGLKPGGDPKRTQ